MTNAGRPITFNEAHLVLSGWKSSSCQIDCSVEIGPMAGTWRGRVIELATPPRVRLLSDEGREFVFDIREDFRVLYAEPRDFPDAAETMVCSLFFFFPPRPEYAKDDDFIVLTELR